MNNAELFKNYTDAALRTAPPLAARDRKIVSALGLADEMLEFILASNDGVCDDFDRGVDELGDIAWYLALLCDSFEISVSDLDFDAASDVCPVHAVSRVVGLIKKHIFHGHPMDNDALCRAVRDIAIGLGVMAAKHGATFETVLANNVDKLRARYPDGFSADRSIHRHVPNKTN